MKVFCSQAGPIRFGPARQHKATRRQLGFGAIREEDDDFTASVLDGRDSLIVEPVLRLCRP